MPTTPQKSGLITNGHHSFEVSPRVLAPAEQADEAPFTLTVKTAKSPYCGDVLYLFRNQTKPSLCFPVHPRPFSTKAFDKMWFEVTDAGVRSI